MGVSEVDCTTCPNFFTNNFNLQKKLFRFSYFFWGWVVVVVSFILILIRGYYIGLIFKNLKIITSKSTI